MFPTRKSGKMWKKNSEGASGSSSSHDPQVMPGMREQKINIAQPRGIPYDQWRGTILDPVWVALPGRYSKVLGDAYRPFIKYTAREFGKLYKEGRKLGQLRRVGVHANCVEIELHTPNPDDVPLNYVFLAFITSLLGDATHNHEHNHELQHFYEMVEKSSEANFWIIEHHPMLMDLEERSFFPSKTRLGLEDCDGDWEDMYLSYSATANFGEINIWNAICDHHSLAAAYQSNNNSNKNTGFSNDCVGLSRFSTALVIHGSDPNRYLPVMTVEHELTNRFPAMLLHLYEFLLLDMYLNHGLTFLTDIRPSN